MESTAFSETVMPPAGCTVRAAAREDAAAVAELRSACLADEGDSSVMTAEEQLTDWEGLDLAEESVVVLAPDGTMVANADVVNRNDVLISVYGGVQPAQRGHGLGAYLVRWGEAWTYGRMRRAPADAQVALQHYINANNASGRALMKELGYTAARGIYVMQVTLEAAPPVPQPPPGIRVRNFVPGSDERATFEAVEDAFKDLWSRPPGNFERFLQMTESARQDPGLWFLAQDEQTGEIAGVCLARITPGASWVGPVGVRRPWRNRGLGLALLRATFGELHRRGIREASLSVDADSPTGAPRLYTRAGMQVAQNIILYRKQLRAGKDYSTLAVREGAAT